jgi:pimeloyl-ACP methyl ester carboxylesterase
MQTVRHPLLTEFRMLLVDFLGFGFSERPLEYGYTMEDHADSVAELLRHIDVRSAQIVGHSMAGSVAIALAMRHPDLVINLVVAECNLGSARPALRSRHGPKRTTSVTAIWCLVGSSSGQSQVCLDTVDWHVQSRLQVRMPFTAANAQPARCSSA